MCKKKVDAKNFFSFATVFIHGNGSLQEPAEHGIFLLQGTDPAFRTSVISVGGQGGSQAMGVFHTLDDWVALLVCRFDLTQPTGAPSGLSIQATALGAYLKPNSKYLPGP